MKWYSIAAVLSAIAALPAMAAEEEEDEEGWFGNVKLGYLATSGNTENSTLNTGFELGYAIGKWQHLLTGAAINAKENEVTTAEAYQLGAKTEYSTSERDYAFARLDWRKDRFSGYETQFSQSIGYGRRLITTDRHELSAEVGVGARQSELQDGTTEDELIVRGGLDYAWQISDTAKFSQTFDIEYGAENTFLTSVTALSTNVLDNVALVASYTIKSNTDVPPLTENTDTYTALALEYQF